MKTKLPILFGLGGVTLLVFLMTLFIVGAVCWPYTINSWLEYAGKDPSILWWHGGLLGFVPVLGQLSIIAAVGTWIMTKFI